MLLNGKPRMMHGSLRQESGAGSLAPHGNPGVGGRWHLTAPRIHDDVGLYA